MIKTKKAWLRILESAIAIFLISGVLLMVFAKQNKKTGIEEDIYVIQKTILNEISKNNDIRKAVLTGDENKIRNFIQPKLPPNFNYTIVICDIDNSVCGLPYLRQTYTTKDIYAQEIVITSTLQEYAPKKVKLFVWIK